MGSRSEVPPPLPQTEERAAFYRRSAVALSGAPSGRFARLFRRVRVKCWRASMVGLKRGPHISRYVMYERLGALAPTLSLKNPSALAVSHSTALCEIMGVPLKNVVEANYPEQNALSLTYEAESFDMVVSDQVLEHVEGNPQQAIDESWRVLRPGGIAVHTTCFMNPIHGEPKDFWRFSPDALRLLCARFGKVIECDGWGNFEAWRLMRSGLRFEPVPRASWHPLHRAAIRNDPLWPIVTWIVASK